MRDPRLAGAYRMCFNSPAGERVLHDLYKFCRVMDTTHVPGESHETAFNEGKRRVFNRIFLYMKPDDERQKLKDLEERRDE